MAETDIGSAVSSDLTNAITDFSVDPMSTEAADGQKELNSNKLSGLNIMVITEVFLNWL